MATTTDTIKMITNDGGWQWKIEPCSDSPDHAFSLWYRNDFSAEWVMSSSFGHDDAKAIAFAILSLLGEVPPKS